MSIRSRIENAWSGITGKAFSAKKVSFSDLQQSRVSSSIDPQPPTTIYGNYFFTNPAVYRAVHLRSEAVSSAPLIVAQAEGERMVPVPTTHPLQRTLNRMNDWWTAADVLYATEANLSIWGSAYWFVDKDSDRGDGGLANIWPLRPDRMTPIPDRGANSGTKPTQYIKGFKYRGENGKDLAFLPEEIVWFRRFNPLNEYEGASPIAPGRASFDMGSQATLFNRNFFINDAMPSDIAITFKDVVTEEEYNSFVRRLKERHAGTGHAHTPMVIDGSEADVKRLGITHRDMEFLESLKWSVEDAARVYGVMPPLMMDREHTTLDNVRQARIEFFSSTISFEWSFLEKELNELLVTNIFPEFGDLTLQFDTTNVPTMQEARVETRKLLISEVEKGLLTINEYRESEGRDGVEWGDVWHGPSMLRPISDGEVLPPPAPVISPFEEEEPETVATESLAQRKNGFINSYMKVVDRTFDRDENEFTRQQKSLFKTQYESVKTALGNEPGLKRDLAGNIFDPDDWQRLYIARGERLMRDIYRGAGSQLSSDFQIAPFVQSSQTEQEFVRTRAAFWAKSVNKETSIQLATEMRAGIEAGESIPVLQKRVDKVFGFANSVRSERIARTEVRAATSAGQLGFIEETDVIERKQWIAAIDERTRPEHSEAHNQIVPKSKPFLVGGESLMAPGIGGSGWNVINCRCVMVPILKDQKNMTKPVMKTYQETNIE
jgi:HK97 family phage portal protein